MASATFRCLERRLCRSFELHVAAFGRDFDAAEFPLAPFLLGVVANVRKYWFFSTIPTWLMYGSMLIGERSPEKNA